MAAPATLGTSVDVAGLMGEVWSQEGRIWAGTLWLGVEGATLAMLAAVNKQYNPAWIVLLADGGANQEFLAKKLSFLETVGMREGVATAYVCKDFTCQLPVTSVEALQEQLREQKPAAKKEN